MYSAKDIAVIIPTKDRPELVKRLLQNLVEQDCAIRRVIVVASGLDIKDIVLSFANHLPVEYYKSEPGQIRQRNLGISLLDESTKLVLALDDDILFLNNSIVEILNYWNTVEASTAGIGFNMITERKDNNFIKNIRNLFFQKKKGRVSITGINIPIYDLSENIQTQWLPGGFTIWRQKVLLEFPQSPLETSFAAGEDVRFSYPIGKKYNLYVCSNAKVTHDIIYDQKTNEDIQYFRGYQNTLGIFHFTDSHQELSYHLAIVFTLFNSFFRLIYGIISFSIPKLKYAKGQFSAIIIALKAKWRKENIILYMENYSVKGSMD